MFIFSLLVVAALFSTHAFSLRIGNQNAHIKPFKRAPLQDLVTWDEHSLFVRGERIMFYSGEFHPFRLPSPGLWLDVFQKIKALGFNGVSFYTDWGLLEGNPGHVVAEGVFALDEFFRSAQEAGIYLIARPGPYINAETAAGGFPGWTLRIKSVLRSTAPEYLNATANYVSTIGKIIADAQITNGGPVVLFQPENEYTTYPGVTNFPSEMNKEYMAYVEQQFRDTGIIVPFIDNDNRVEGAFAPGTGVGAVDIYGIDAYPLLYDCAHPYVWPNVRFPRDWQTIHRNQSPTTPFSIAEFQGGAGSGWGAVGEDQCAILVNDQAVRVLYKNNYSFGVKLFNVYMTYGGTNWGNLGYFGGYTSYDYGAAITEDRYLWREKYSETKLEANFLKASPAYLTATPGNATNGSYASTDAITVTPLFGSTNGTNFYVVRHADWTSTNSTSYRLSVPINGANLTIPQLNSSSLTLSGRDSKIHVTNYDVGGLDLVYSTAEVYTWAKGANSKRVLLLYGLAGEIHEASIPDTTGEPRLAEGSGITVQKIGANWVFQWQVTPDRQIVRAGNLEIYLLWRNEAYKYWSLELPASTPTGNYSSPSKATVIVKAGYLVRSAALEGSDLRLVGDVNATTDVELISAPSPNITTLSFNGLLLQTQRSGNASIAATIEYQQPQISTPDLSGSDWKYIDSLPEISLSYDDTRWTACTNPTTNNPRNLTTPTSLYASDYGYHAGSLIYRGHFTSTGNESTFFVNITGGYGFAYSAWLNSDFLGSWVGSGSYQTYNSTFKLPSNLLSGSSNTFTVLIDHTGQDEEGPGTDAIKFPRGILDYSLSGHPLTDVQWKITGNFGGEQYPDLARGPRNEGAMFAERKGYHLPDPPSGNWSFSNPVSNGISKAGVGFYTTTFNLDVPTGYDVPMSVVLNGTAGAGATSMNGTVSNHRVQIFVNGWQFGKYGK
ncbi:MAG: hypothetical protein Q9227_007812 [Pyrenula ochraceoflavens]